MKEGGHAVPFTNLFETMSIENMPAFFDEQISPQNGLKHMNSQKISDR